MIYLVVLAMTLISAVGAFCLKAGMDRVNGFWSMFTNPRLYIGGFCYLAGAVMNIWLLSRLEYSILYPMTAITYIWSMALAWLFLKEQITRRKLVGMTVIIIGVWILTR